MRLSLLAFTAVVALAASGCDSSGVDTPTTPGGGTGTGGSGDGTGTDTTGTPALTFAPVDVTATYLRSDDETPYATPLLLSDYGLEPGDTACFRATGDFYPYAGTLASSTGDPLVTGAFSASSELAAPADARRIKDAIDGDWHIETRPSYTTGAPTDIDEDWEATDACWTVPAGATHVFFSVYDDMFLDNTDALVNGEAFGVAVSER